MSIKEEIESKVKAQYDQMQKDNTITPTAFDRSIGLYDKIGEIIKEYSNLLTHPVLGESYSQEMEQKIIFLLAKELDKNFYEGAIDVVTRNMMQLVKIPKVQEITKGMLKVAVTKLGGKEEMLKQILNTDSQSPEKNSDLNDLLNNLSETTRTKKENLN